MKTPAIKKSATLREQVYQVVVNELKGGTFTPGERITEEGLAKRLCVSRTPIREALMQLSKQGVLRLREGGGYIVPSPSIDELRQVIAVRTLLEPAAARMAASEYDQAKIDLISRAIDAEAAAIDDVQPAQFARANEDFRHAMFLGISNKKLSGLIAQFANHLHFIRGATLNNVGLREEIVERQKKIRDALKHADADLVEGLWRSYLRFTEEMMTAALMSMSKTAEKRPSIVKANAA
ncbi:MAG: GntR family transcriptional regulator [Gammaproteobacteria bacterium]